MKTDIRRAAQQRVDRIRQFQAELADLDRELGSFLADDQLRRLKAHHDQLLTRLESEGGADISDSARRISWGIRLVSLLGCAAFAAAVVLFLHRIWGALPLSGQIAILIGVPVLPLAATEIVFRRGMDSFHVGLAAALSILACWQAMEISSVILNLAPQPHFLLTLGVIASLLGHAYSLRIAATTGLVLLGVYLAALGVELQGGDWQYWALRGHYLLPSAAVFYGMSWGPRRWRTRFEPLVRTYAFSGGLLALVAFLLMSTTGHTCCGAIGPKSLVALDQVAGLTVAGWLVGHGLRRGWGNVVYLGATGFIGFLFLRLHAWWWHWMPKYLFFLLLTLIAIGLLVAFQKCRRRWAGGDSS
ncbi:MAG: hypothetical protein IT581_00370 [Verrucomicrobiales bacterium]|nr:hypothetical protein [Verrucomicrobiales bacterium]